MHIPRIYLHEPLSSKTTVVLPVTASHHISRVLRRKAGDPLILFNGDGQEYCGVISDISRRAVTVIIEKIIKKAPKPTCPIHLYQAVAKSDRMDSIIQKATELGVDAFTPIITEYCQLKLERKLFAKKQQAWGKIMIQACEQSSRNNLVNLHPITQYQEILDNLTTELNLIYHPEQTIQNLPSKPSSIGVFIGPEGGFSSTEINLAKDCGIIPQALGPRLLRVDTATAAALTHCQLTWGDLCGRI